MYTMRTVLFFLLFCLTLILPAHAGEFKVLTNQLPPIKMEKDGIATGMVGDILTRIMAENGVPLEKGDTQQAPVAEAYQSATTTPGHIFLALVRSPARENHLKWVGPVYTTSMGFIAKKSSKIVMHTASDAHKYKTGSITKSASESMAIRMGVDENELIRCSVTSNAIDKLDSGDIDILIFPKSPAFYRMLSKNIDPDKYDVVFEMKSVDFYIGFNKATDDTLIEKLQKSLDKMKQVDSTGISPYQQIIAHYFRPTL